MLNATPPRGQLDAPDLEEWNMRILRELADVGYWRSLKMDTVKKVIPYLVGCYKCKESDILTAISWGEENNCTPQPFMYKFKNGRVYQVILAVEVWNMGQTQLPKGARAELPLAISIFN